MFTTNGLNPPLTINFELVWIQSRSTSKCFSIRKYSLFSTDKLSKILLSVYPNRFFAPCNVTTFPSPSHEDDAIENIVDNPTKNEASNETSKGKSFWGAVGLIIGATVGPGMLGLPSLTIKSGPFPSTIIILVSWLYVISSIIIIAELCFDSMEEHGLEEVSFTSLATNTLGSGFGAFVVVVYSTLCFSLLVACVASIGSIFSPWFPRVNILLVHAMFPLLVGTLLGFFPFSTIDVANRLLCFLMLFSITGLVAIGILMARDNIINSFAFASWRLSSILPMIPVIVLTMGFHVITPFICKVAGNTIVEARKAILIGGVVPLVIVLSWNLIVLGLVGTNNTKATSSDPISLLLSVNPSALSSVQGFAFSAMATNLIGYALSLPKQLLDTLELVFGKVKVLVTLSLLGFSVLIASFFQSTFSRALDFAGVYANCFLFGIIPPVMAYMQQSKKKIRSSSIIPGGNGTLLLLFVISLILGIWH
uniref:Tyrosine-specific transport protein 1 n=1 Tax=Cajanus cajan TaxID=3821 RepID=A0A151U8K7_CAJCA|nr:Tyrosine-specific transport protein 1 [Cajanus cajan]